MKLAHAIFVFRKFHRHHDRPLFPLRTGVTITIKFRSIATIRFCCPRVSSEQVRNNGVFERFWILGGKGGKIRAIGAESYSKDPVIHASEITRVNYSW